MSREKLKSEIFEDVDNIRKIEGNWVDYLANYLEANIDEILDCYEEHMVDI